jgi:cytochrome c oxidase subunit IV
VILLSKNLIVLAALLFFLMLSFFLAQLELGWLHLPVSLTIAAIKASLVALFFMSLSKSDGMHRVFSMAGIFFLAILLSLTLADFVSRGWIALPGPFPELALP